MKGVAVLAAEQMHSLPHATQLMALMGAEVIKVEPVGGEAGRFGRPDIIDSDGRPTGSTFLRNNLAKTSVGIDLKHRAGRELFLRLAATVDVVAENFRPGTADGLGIGYDAVRATNPSVIYVSVSGFGNRPEPPSPYRQWAAYAPIVEGMAGLYEYSRAGDERPRPAVAGALGDTGPGLYAVIGVLAALFERTMTGLGAHVDIAMYDAMIAIADVVHPASMGVDPSRALDGIGILHTFRAEDGWFAVEVVREAHFPRFAQAVGHPEWISDERLASRRGWSDHMETVIRPGVEAWASSLGKLEAASRLAEQGVAAGPVNSAADIVSDAHVRGRRLVHQIQVDDREVAVVGNPIAFRSQPAHLVAPAPRPPGTGPADRSADRAERPPRWPLLGEGTERVLAGRLGLTPTEIDDLRAQGVIT
jgi:crotonobetainyl-CoA:carnitine CoA-transferase CaiB-like acyl-CoA transferase